MSCHTCAWNTADGCAHPQAIKAGGLPAGRGPALGQRVLEWAAEQNLDADGMPQRDAAGCPGASVKTTSQRSLWG